MYSQAMVKPGSWSLKRVSHAVVIAEPEKGEAGSYGRHAAEVCFRGSPGKCIKASMTLKGSQLWSTCRWRHGSPKGNKWI